MRALMHAGSVAAHDRRVDPARRVRAEPIGGTATTSVAKVAVTTMIRGDQAQAAFPAGRCSRLSRDRRIQRRRPAAQSPVRRRGEAVRSRGILISVKLLVGVGRDIGGRLLAPRGPRCSADQPRGWRRELAVQRTSRTHRARAARDKPRFVQRSRGVPREWRLAGKTGSSSVGVGGRRIVVGRMQDHQQIASTDYRHVGHRNRHALAKPNGTRGQNRATRRETGRRDGGPPDDE